MPWYEIINAKSDSYIADRDAEDLLRQLATALQTEDGPVEAEVFYGLTSQWRAPLLSVAVARSRRTRGTGARVVRCARIDGTT